MKNLFKKTALALLVTASVGISTAQSAADADALGRSDTAVYGVIGLTSVTSLDCYGVNMGIYRIGLNQPAYSGTITVSAAGNASSNLSTLAISNSSGISSASNSLPGTGYCRLSGLTAPTAADYKMTMTSPSSNFAVGTTTDVVNPTNTMTAATTAAGGMSLVMSLVNAVPAIDLTNDLYWRIGGVATFASTVVSSVNNYGGYKSSPATVTISANN